MYRGVFLLFPSELTLHGRMSIKSSTTHRVYDGLALIYFQTLTYDLHALEGLSHTVYVFNLLK